MQTSSQITVRRLNWAGVEIVRDQHRILIDPMENAEPFEHLLGKPRRPLEPVPDFTGTTVTLVTLTEQLVVAAEREKVRVNWVRENDLIRKNATEY